MRNRKKGERGQEPLGEGRDRSQPIELRIGGLRALPPGRTTAAASRRAAEGSLGATLAAATTAVVAPTSPARGTATVGGVLCASVRSRLGPALLHHDVLAVHGVGVRGNGGLVALRSGKLDKGAVLSRQLAAVVMKYSLDSYSNTYLLPVDIKVGQGPVAGEGRLEVGILDLLRDILDVT